MLCSNFHEKRCLNESAEQTTPTENGLEHGFVKGPVIIYRLGMAGGGGIFGAKQGEI